MISKDRDKECDESDIVLRYGSSDDAKVKESSLVLDDSASKKESAKETAGYISKLPFVTWTLVPIIGIVFCLIHSHQDSLWQWTGDTAADAQSLQAKVVVSLFSAIIGGCVVAILSKAFVSMSFVLLRYRGASFSHLATVIEGYSPSRIPIIAVGGEWASCILIILILAVSVTTKQIAVVSMGVEFVATNNTKVSYTKNYTNCQATMGASTIITVGPFVVAQTFNAILIPNSSYTSENYDSSIPLGLAGYSEFERVLPFAEASCVQFNSSTIVVGGVPPVNRSGTWQADLTLPLTLSLDDRFVNCTLKVGYANANSTCRDTKCETIRTSQDITPFAEGGNGLPSYLSLLFNNYAPNTSKNRNPIVAWLLGADILSNGDELPVATTAESVANRLAILGTVMARAMCDVNSSGNDFEGETRILLDSPITSNYIEHSYYQYKALWRWPFYVLAGCIFALWMLCMIAMWLAPESRVLSIDWLLNQYISGHHHGYLSGADLLSAHRAVRYQVFDGNANCEVGNIIISPKESYSLAKQDRVIQNKQYQ
ncbi:hypothetical protein MBANPS3_003593 [Mucor bainieri]